MNPAAKLRATTVDIHKDGRWSDFVSRHPASLIYHHPGWLSVLEREYGQECTGLACEDEEGNLRAILPLFFSKGLPFRLGRSATCSRYSCLPRTPVTGPLALDDEAMAAILHQAIDLVRNKRGVQLEIKTHHDNLAKLAPELTSISWGCTYVEELPSEIEVCGWEDFCENVRLPRECGPCQECKRLRFGNAKQQHRVNWAVNKATKLGLRVREAESESDVGEWYPLYLDSMRHHAFPPRPERFFRDLWTTLRPAGQMKLLVAGREENGRDRMVAGSIFLRFGQTVFYAFTGCAHRDFHLHPHDILQLESIRDSCKNGYRWYDFGEASADGGGLAQFKGKWGTEPKALYRYYYPSPLKGQETKASPFVSLMRRGWRSLPLRVTAALGEKIHRYM